MIDLPPKHLLLVKKILAQHTPSCEVRAFGSRVSGNAKPYSDLDLAFLCANALPQAQLFALQIAFEDSELPIKVDVLDWHSIPAEFQALISKNYVVIQEPPKTTG